MSRKYEESKAASGEILRMVVPAMAAHNAACHPVSYAVWYEYFSGRNARLRTELDPRLQRGEPVEFKKGDIALFDAETADNLISGGIAKLANEQPLVFRRKLNDYDTAFATLNRRYRETVDDEATVDRHLAEVQSALARTNEQITLLEADKTMVAADLQKVQHERDELVKYQTALATKLADTRAELSRLYNDNLQLQRELKELSDRLTEEIESRVRQATASAP